PALHARVPRLPAGGRRSCGRRSSPGRRARGGGTAVPAARVPRDEERGNAHLRRRTGARCRARRASRRLARGTRPLPGRGAALASAHHGAAFPGAATCTAARPRARRGGAVRCRCFHFSAAPRRGAVCGLRGRTGRRLMQVDREQALDTALGQIERSFGKGAVMRMSDQAQVSVGAISTGSLALDLALGIGGLPRGRIVEIFGPESSGKTTLVYHVIAEAQRRGGICAFIDAEHAMDPVYAKRIGVNIDELLVSQPDTGEQALEITELLVRSGALSVVAIDSVAALTPKAEIEGEMGDSHVGL